MKQTRHITLPKNNDIKHFYYSCDSCGRQIDSYEYYTYGKCDVCRYI